MIHKLTLGLLLVFLAGCRPSSFEPIIECHEAEVTAITNADGVWLSQSYVATAPIGSCLLVGEKAILTLLGIHIEKRYICEICP